AITGRESPCRRQRLGVALKIPVREQDALRRSGRARRVKERGGLVARAADRREALAGARGAVEQSAAAVGAERQHDARSGRRRERSDGALVARVADDGARLGMPEQRLELVRLVRRIDRVEDETRAEAREIEAEALRRFLGLNRDAVADVDTG